MSSTGLNFKSFSSTANTSLNNGARKISTRKKGEDDYDMRLGNMPYQMKTLAIIGITTP
jgi:hypothetical protein